MPKQGVQNTQNITRLNNNEPSEGDACDIMPVINPSSSEHTHTHNQTHMQANVYSYIHTHTHWYTCNGARPGIIGLHSEVIWQKSVYKSSRVLRILRTDDLSVFEDLTGFPLARDLVQVRMLALPLILQFCWLYWQYGLVWFCSWQWGCHIYYVTLSKMRTLSIKRLYTDSRILAKMKAF